MIPIPDRNTAIPVLPLEERLELANQLYREFHCRCFWHCPPDLIITEDLLYLVVNGLRKHGGRRGFILSGMLRDKKSSLLQGEASEYL